MLKSPEPRFLNRQSVFPWWQRQKFIRTHGIRQCLAMEDLAQVVQRQLGIPHAGAAYVRDGASQGSRAILRIGATGGKQTDHHNCEQHFSKTRRLHKPLLSRTCWGLLGLHGAMTGGYGKVRRFAEPRQRYRNGDFPRATFTSHSL